MIEQLRISSPLAESWVAWALLSLLVVALIANQRQSGLIAGAFSALVRQEDRRYRDVGSDIFQWLLVRYFSAGVPALLLYAYYFHEPPFVAWKWLLIVGAWVLIDLFKNGMVLLLRYTFGLEKLLPNVSYLYGDVWLLTGVCLYPMAVLVIYVGSGVWTTAAILLMATLLFMMALLTIARTLLVNMVSALYILIYFLTLEVLPIALICKMVNLIS